VAVVLDLAVHLVVFDPVLALVAVFALVEVFPLPVAVRENLKVCHMTQSLCHIAHFIKS
jgi:hypothetical protein